MAGFLSEALRVIYFVLSLAVSIHAAGQTRYNEGLAWKLLNLAGAAYGNRYGECVNLSFPQNEQRYIYTSATQECDVIDSSCSAFIVNSNVTREVIFVFRGTKTKTQLALEGWESYKPGEDFYGMGNVNRYFRRAHESLWPTLLEFLSHPEFAGYSVIVTGHSLGGALASLAAAHIVKSGLRPSQMVKLYTFGQPRTGSFNYAMNFKNLNIESYRVVYAADIVPHQPACFKNPNQPPNADGSRPCLAEPSNEAYHHGIEIWYPQSMQPNSLYLECLGSPQYEDMNCSDQLTFQVTGYGKSGCTDRTVTPPKKSRFATAINKVSDLLGFFKRNARALHLKLK